MSIIQIKGFKCDRCGHVWKLRGERSEPKVCAGCHSAYWNEPRRKPRFSATFPSNKSASLGIKRKKKEQVKGTSGSRGSSVKQPVRLPTRGRGGIFGTSVRKNTSRTRVPRLPTQKDIDKAGIGGAT
jgi:hypothetical protein